MNFFRKINKQNDAHRIVDDAKSHTQSRCGGTVQNRFGYDVFALRVDKSDDRGIVEQTARQ